MTVMIFSPLGLACCLRGRPAWYNNKFQRPDNGYGLQLTEDCITATTRRTTTANTGTPATAQANESDETIVQQMYTVHNKN